MGILGGTFDPIHLGHIHLAKTVYQKCELQDIQLIPCYQSPLRDHPHTQPEDRLQMMKLATTDYPYLIINDLELKRQGPSYTIDSLKLLRKMFSETPLCLICGMDAFNSLEAWHCWQNIFDFAHLIVADRTNSPQILTPGLAAQVEQRQILDAAEFKKKIAGNILFIDINPLPISATEIRRLISNKQNAQHLLNPNVWEYIVEHQLYKS